MSWSSATRSRNQTRRCRSASAPLWLKCDPVSVTESVASTIFLWIFAIRYDAEKPPIRILVNGQTGKAGGEIPTSWAKVAFLAATILGLLAVPVILAVLVGLLQ